MLFHRIRQNGVSNKRWQMLLSSLLVLALSGCSKPNASIEVKFRAPVSVTTVKADDMVDSVVVTGTLRAPELVTLTVMTGGLLEINERDGRRLEEGDRVVAGEVIARITGEDVRLAMRRKLVKQRLSSAQTLFEATEKLYQDKMIGFSEYARVKTDLEDARLAYENSEHLEDRNTLVSPIDGVLLSLVRDADGQLMANGQLVNPGQEIAQVGSLNSLIADVDLVGKQIAQVKEGLPAITNYHSWSQDFQSNVLRLAPTVDLRSRSMKAQVSVDNKDGLLKPGMFVKVTIVTEMRKQVPVVPRRAVTDRGGRAVVFVVSGQRAEKREVALGLGNEQQVEILSGVQLGESVVVSGLETLTDHMPVTISAQ